MKDLSQIFLNEFHGSTSTQKLKKIQSLIDSTNVDAIVSLAELDSEFAVMCNLADFKERWVSLWSTYGVIITKDATKALYDQPTASNKFELFCGIYYYQRALVTASNFKKDYSVTEINDLQKAISYESIHACQRYNTYLYSQIDNDKYEYSNGLFGKIIRQIKPLVSIYGCYAYLMLAEAYVRYGMFLQKNGIDDKANGSFSAALAACQNARQGFNPNSVSIYNASFGGTLAESNSLGLSELEDIIACITALKEGSLEQDFFDSLNQSTSCSTIL